jgi:hypothetical protein
VTIKGQFQVLGRSWRAFPRQKVYIVYNQKGTAYWAALGSTRTNSKGSFEFQAQGATSNFVALTYAVYQGDAQHLACSSVGIAVDNTGDKAGGSAAPAAPPTALAPRPNLPELLKLADAPELRVPLVPAFRLPGAFLGDLFERASPGN